MISKSIPKTQSVFRILQCNFRLSVTNVTVSREPCEGVTAIQFTAVIQLVNNKYDCSPAPQQFHYRPQLLSGSSLAWSSITTSY